MNEIEIKNETWRKIEPTTLRQIRAMLILKHGSLTKVSYNLRVKYTHLSDTIAGRLQLFNIVSAIQSDLELTDEQVLQLWPLLRQWPKESRRVG